MHRSRIAPETSSARSAWPGHRVVEEHERVQVAVAGVEDVGHPDAARRRTIVGDAAQHLGQRGARDDAVLHDVVRADPADRGERRLAALPEQRPLGVVGRDADLERPAVAAERLDLRRTAPRPRRAGPSSSTMSTAPGALRVAAVHRRLGRLDRERVHHLDRGRHDAGADDRRHRARPRRRWWRTRRAGVRTVSGAARSAGRVTSVAMPSVPSEPTNAPSRS